MAENDNRETKADGFVVYELGEKDEGITITLSMTHRRFILFLAERGGECSYDYRKVKPELKKHMKHLVAMNVISEITILGCHRDDVRLRLTDIGRNLVPILRGEVV